MLSQMSFRGPKIFGSFEKRTPGCQKLENLRVENELIKNPQNEIIVPFRDSYQNFLRTPLSIYGNFPTAKEEGELRGAGSVIINKRNQ